MFIYYNRCLRKNVPKPTSVPKEIMPTKDSHIFTNSNFWRWSPYQKLREHYQLLFHRAIKRYLSFAKELYSAKLLVVVVLLPVATMPSGSSIILSKNVEVGRWENAYMANPNCNLQFFYSENEIFQHISWTENGRYISPTLRTKTEERKIDLHSVHITI